MSAACNEDDAEAGGDELSCGQVQWKKYPLQPEMGEIPGESSRRSKQFWNAASKPALTTLCTFV